MKNISNKRFRSRLGVAAAICGMLATFPALPANANTGMTSRTSVATNSIQASEDPATAALDEFRANLVAKGDAEGVARFDAFTEAQRDELAQYLLGESVNFTPPADATWDETGTATKGGFSWEIPSGYDVAAQSDNIPVWGTQSFSFLGIPLIVVKNAMVYTVDWNSSKGWIVTGVPSSRCTVVYNYDIYASVESVTNAAFVYGTYEAQNECKVTVRRGVPSPWGTIAWSTREAIHVLRADNTGWITRHAWE